MILAQGSFRDGLYQLSMSPHSSLPGLVHQAPQQPQSGSQNVSVIVN